MTNPAITSFAFQSISHATAATPSSAAGAGSSPGRGGFSSIFGAGMQQADHLEAEAQSSVMDLLRGGGTEVHDAMIATQQSELTFELALQVRNKAVAAYQQMMQMQF